MKICAHGRLQIAVLTRNEHCPPHVHVGSDDWDARFEFAFWHDSVRLWDVLPARRAPTAALLETLRQVVMEKRNLKRARELWWRSRRTLCLDHLHWDTVAQEVVRPTAGRRRTVPIESGRFDAAQSLTILKLAGRTEPLEIQL